MSVIAIERNATEEVFVNVLTNLRKGEIDDAIAPFAEEFTFKDRGLGPEFKDTRNVLAIQLTHRAGIHTARQHDANLLRA